MIWYTISNVCVIHGNSMHWRIQQVFVCWILRLRIENKTADFPFHQADNVWNEHSTGEQSHPICGHTRLCLQVFKISSVYCRTLKPKVTTKKRSRSVIKLSFDSNYFNRLIRSVDLLFIHIEYEVAFLPWNYNNCLVLCLKKKKKNEGKRIQTTENISMEFYPIN